MQKGRLRFGCAALVLVSGLVLAAGVLPGEPLHAQPTGTESAAREQAEERATAIVAQLTLEEKLPQLLNTAPAIPRLGIPAYNWWTESLHGAMGPLPTTNFPEPIGLAATFDAPLVKDVASAISKEVRGLHALARQTGRMGRIGTGLDTWSPNLNIFRDPRWGRGQETYGEDPYLTASLGVAFVEGMQGENPALPDVVATPKHFAVHSGPESTRHHANVYVSIHDLEDTYLPAFRAAIVDGRAGSVMCAYNRVDGQPACASDDLLEDVLRDAWGFDGYVVSDCDAVRDIHTNHHYAPDPATAVAAALRSGVDLECHTATLSDTAGLEDRYREALERGLITEADVDRALVRMFSARLRTGDLPGIRPLNTTSASPADVGTDEHGATALHAAEESLVLLKNNGILPLSAGDLRVAVIGPFGDATRVLRGNYSGTISAPPVSVVEGLRRAMPGAAVTYVPFGESFTDGDPVPESALQTEDGQPGLMARYYNAVGEPPRLFGPGELETFKAQVRYEEQPTVSRRERSVDGRSLDLAEVTDHHRVVWSGYLVPPESGLYRLGLSGFQTGSMTFDGEPFIDLDGVPWGSLPTLKTVSLEKGRSYPIEIVGVSETGSAGIGLAWKRVSADPVAALREMAADADVLVAVVGLTSDLEAEESPVEIPGFAGGDKTTLDIPADQQALLEVAEAMNKPLIVVAMNGSPINLAWAKEHADAIVEAWYPGQAGGLAIANVLSGKANPSGRLPLTFYRGVDQLPPFDDYRMEGRTYRYYEGETVYPFGHGLSYTAFAYGPVTVTPASAGAEGGIRVEASLRNTGDRPGDEVAQLYLTFPDRPGVPNIALRGFQRVRLAPGESKRLSFDLSPRDLSAVNPEGVRMVMAGAYTVHVGSGQPETGAPVSNGTFEVERTVELPR